MPLVKIDLIKGQRSSEEIKHMADVVQQVLIDRFAAPERDRYQVEPFSNPRVSELTHSRS